MQPSIGRIVHYSLDRRPVAAIITGINDENDFVDLIVFPAGELPSPVVDVQQGNQPGQWNWPPRV